MVRLKIESEIGIGGFVSGEEGYELRKQFPHISFKHYNLFTNP